MTLGTALQAKESSRAEFMVQFGSILGSALLAPGAAKAAKYGGFGADSPNVLNPKDAIIDDEILKSSSVQRSIEGLKGYLGGVRQMKEALLKNGQTDVGPYLRKEFDFVKLREELNSVNTAFDEDTQRGTDLSLIHI